MTSTSDASDRQAAGDPSRADDATYMSQELRVAIGRVARRLRRISAERDAAGAVKFNELLVMIRLADEGPQSTTDLAKREHVTSQAITGIVRDLEARGHVVRDAHAEDGRRTVITLTRAGLEAIRSHDQAAVGLMEAALAEHFTAAEVRRLASAIPLLGRLADVL